MQQGYDVKGLANSVLIEWVNNNNNFCKRGAPPTTQLTLQPCSNSTAQTFMVEVDGSIRHGGSASQCLDVYNCEKADGTAVGLYPCHPGGKAECGYANQQFKAVDGTIVNDNSGTCLTAIGPVGHQRIVISTCVAGSRAQEFEAAAAGGAGAVKAADGRCLAYASVAPHCCESGWLSQIDSQQDLTLDSLSHPGYWNDNDMLSVGCNAPGVNGTAHTPCAGYQSLLEQRSQFALWCVLASPLILGHDVTTMGPEVRSIITNTEMIALNQDALGHRAAIAYQSDPYNRTLTIFVKHLANSSSPRAAALFNRGDTVTQLSLTRTQMAFDAGTCACVDLRDIDAHETVVSGVHGEVLFTQELQPHEVRVLRASCC